jgi:SRSO17 transposase
MPETSVSPLFGLRRIVQPERTTAADSCPPGSGNVALQLDTSWLQRLDDFAEQFREDFQRRDQARWTAVYLQGLLLPVNERKTIGTMARHIVVPADLTVEDVAQALQNFVNQSPWDEARVCKRLRGRFAAEFGDPSGVFVVDELAIPKQGRHSVGVHRQFSSVLGKKTNCQVAIVLYYIAGSRIVPLSIRLYLPRNWQTGAPQAAVASVPEQFRLTRSKATIALELLDEARSDGFTGRFVVACNRQWADREFRASLTERQLSYVAEADPDQPSEEVEYRDVSEQNVTWVSDQPFERLTLRASDTKQEARRLGLSLLNEFGLNDFEGRSWRGFHHHACLVLLAYLFHSLEEKSPPSSIAL